MAYEGFEFRGLKFFKESRSTPGAHEFAPPASLARVTNPPQADRPSQPAISHKCFLSKEDWKKTVESFLRRHPNLETLKKRSPLSRVRKFLKKRGL